MSLESHQRGLFLLVSRKRDRSPSSRSEESLILAPRTPPAAERKRIFDDDEVDEDWGATMQEWEHKYVSEIQEPHKISGNRPCCKSLDALLLPYQDGLDDHASPNFPDECWSHLQLFAMSTFDLSAESYNICTQPRTKSRLLSLSREGMDIIANATTAAVSAFPSTPRPADHKPIVVQPATTVEALQSSHPEDDESSNLRGKSNHDHPSDEENSVGGELHHK